MDELLTREEVAAKLKVSIRWTYTNLPSLIRHKGFPKPRLPNKWSRVALEAWMQGRPIDDRHTPEPIRPANDAAEARSQRAAGLAARAR